MPIKVCLDKPIVFPVVMYGCELDYKESWAPKNWCFWTVVLKTRESLGQQGDPKGNQSWIFTGKTDAEAEAPIIWPSDVKNWLIGKDPDAGKDWRQEEKGRIEGEMVGWHHRLNDTWVWVNSGSWWWTGKPGMLQSMWSQRVGHNWVTELNWTSICNLGNLPISNDTYWNDFFSIELSWYLHQKSDDCKSVQFSHSVVSDSLWPHGLQHTRFPCPSSTPGACSNSCP